MWGNSWKKNQRQGYPLWKGYSGIQGSNAVVWTKNSDCFQKYLCSWMDRTVILSGKTRMYPRVCPPRRLSCPTVHKSEITYQASNKSPRVNHPASNAARLESSGFIGWRLTKASLSHWRSSYRYLLRICYISNSSSGPGNRNKKDKVATLKDSCIIEETHTQTDHYKTMSWGKW